MHLSKYETPYVEYTYYVENGKRVLHGVYRIWSEYRRLQDEPRSNSCLSNTKYYWKGKEYRFKRDYDECKKKDEALEEAKIVNKSW